MLFFLLGRSHSAPHSRVITANDCTRNVNFLGDLMIVDCCRVLQKGRSLISPYRDQRVLFSNGGLLKTVLLSDVCNTINFMARSKKGKLGKVGKGKISSIFDVKFKKRENFPFSKNEQGENSHRKRGKSAF